MNFGRLNNKGFTLAENLVSILILATLSVSLVIFFVSNITLTEMAKRSVAAFQQAQSIVENLKSHPYNNPNLAPNIFPYSEQHTLDLGPEGTNPINATFTVNLTEGNFPEHAKYIRVDMAIPNGNGGVLNDTLETIYYEHN